jgi:hypothetical protein
MKKLSRYGKSEMLTEKRVTVPLCPSQIPHCMACERTPGLSSERPASTHLRRGMGSTDKLRISRYLSSLTLNTAVIIVRPIGRRHATDTFIKNVYSAGSTLSQCDTLSHYQPASAADKARETAYQTPLRSSLYEQLKESCEFCDVFEKHLELSALYFPVYHASSPRTNRDQVKWR